MKSFLIPLMASVAIAAAASGATAAPDVVVSVKPIHSLVAAIMRGVGEPQLIVDGAASPHTYNLRPSNARKLEKADVVFWVGPGLEAFLKSCWKRLPARQPWWNWKTPRGWRSCPSAKAAPLKHMTMATKAMMRMTVTPKRKAHTIMDTTMRRVTGTTTMAHTTPISGSIPPTPRPWRRRSKPR